MKKTILKKYAQLAVKSGVNLKKGQGCVIFSEVEQHEFAEMVAEEAYRLSLIHISEPTRPY